jgi:hypothetical protein
MVFAAAIPATLLIFCLDAGGTRTDTARDAQAPASAMPSPYEIQRLRPKEQHGVAGVFGPPLDQEGFQAGFGPERSPLPYLVVWVPTLLLLELLRREIRKRMVV